MKNIKILLATAIIAAFTLTSCNKDDNNTPAVPAVLEAKWTPTKTIVKTGSGAPTTENYTGNEVGCDKDYIQFVNGGTVKDVVFNKNAADQCGLVENTTPSVYTKNSTTLVVVGGDLDGTYKINSLTNSELVIEKSVTVNTITTIYTFYYTKVV